MFPTEALVWENLLWTCSVCNQSKGDCFPPDTRAGEALINPVNENVWDFFFIDEFGNLTARWRLNLGGPDPRAKETVCVIGLDRDALQQSRQARIVNLRQMARDALLLFAAGRLTAADLRARIQTCLTQPFQPDIADYFLAGPGQTEEPFAELLRTANP